MIPLQMLVTAMRTRKAVAHTQVQAAHAVKSVPVRVQYSSIKW